MAEKDKPEETTKKKALLGGVKVPLDAILLVVAPFVTFVMLFMYVMGLLPPRPMTVKVVGAAPLEAPEVGPAVAEATADVQRVGPAAEGVPDAAGGNRLDETPARPQAADSVSMSPDNAASGEPIADGSAPDTAYIDEAAVGKSPTETAEVDGDRVQRIEQLAKVYEQMNASSVAAIVANMREDDAVAILSRMKPRNAAKVLASLDPEKAATLSLRLTE
jgi:hypothetical protein